MMLKTEMSREGFDNYENALKKHLLNYSSGKEDGSKIIEILDAFNIEASLNDLVSLRNMRYQEIELFLADLHLEKRVVFFDI